MIRDDLLSRTLQLYIEKSPLQLLSRLAPTTKTTAIVTATKVRTIMGMLIHSTIWFQSDTGLLRIHRRINQADF
jgi:hypothetical protein